jgi:hypothetical protein
MRLLAMVIMMIPSVALAQQTPAKPPAKLTPYRTIDSAACSGDATVWVDSAARVYYLCVETLRRELVQEGFDFVGGRILPPTKPGLGIELNMEVLRRYKVA